MYPHHHRMTKNPSSSSSLSGRRNGSLLPSSSSGFPRASSAAGFSLRGASSNNSMPPSFPNSAVGAIAPDAPVESFDTTGVGADILDFGADLGLCEENTRNINKEVEGIVAMINVTHANIHKERVAMGQLEEDHKYSYEEMESLWRSAKEVTENAETHAYTRGNLDGTLQKDLVESLLEPSLDNSDGTESDMTNKKYLQVAEQDHEELKLAVETKTMETIQAETIAVKEATAYYKNTIVREDLEGLLVQKKLDTENFSREFEKEGKRKEQLQSNLNAMRESVGRNAREITEKRRLLAEDNQRFLVEQKELEEKLEQAQTALSGRKTQEDWEKEVAAEEERCALLQRMIENAEAMIKKRQETKKERENEELVIVKLKKEQDELTAQLADKEASAQSAEEDLAKAKVETEVVAAEKLANDQYEADKVLPAMAKMEGILKEKEKLAKSIRDTNDEMKVDAEAAILEEKNLSDDHMALQEQSKDLRGKLEAKTKDMGALAGERDEETAAFAQEFGQLESMLKDLEGAIATETATVDAAKEEHDKRVAESQTALEEAKLVHSAYERHNTILEFGVKLKHVTQQKVSHMEAEWEAEKKRIEDGTFLETVKEVPYDVEAELGGFLTQSLTQHHSQHH